MTLPTGVLPSALHITTKTVAVGREYIFERTNLLRRGGRRSTLGFHELMGSRILAAHRVLVEAGSQWQARGDCFIRPSPTRTMF